MVNGGVSYKVVKESLGHKNKNSIRHYARLDNENLRKCAQKPPSVTPNSFFSDFLKERQTI